MRSAGVKGRVHAKTERIKGMGMSPLHVVVYFLKADAAYTADRICKIFIRNFFAYADSLENLSRLVGLNGRNTHLRRDLDNAMKNGLVVVVYGNVEVFVKYAKIHELTYTFIDKIWIDCPRSVAEKGSEMMNVPRLGAFKYYGYGRSLFCFDQVLLNSRYSQQRGDGHMIFVNAAV